MRDTSAHALGAIERIVSEPAYKARIAVAYGERGSAWLGGVSESIKACAASWALKLEKPYPPSYNLVLPGCDRLGAPIVLKMVPPSSPEFTSELRSLELASARTVRLLDADRNAGALLLERAVPGTKLSVLAAHDDDAATAAAAPVLRDVPVKRPPGDEFPTIEQWGRQLTGYDLKQSAVEAWVSRSTFIRAAGIYEELSRGGEDRVLLHGDLHHFNILASSGPAWIAIDPKGVIGPRSYEVGALLRNPGPSLVTEQQPVLVTRRRIALLAESLELSREVVWGWGFSQAMLSAAWAHQDGEVAWRDYAVACAGIIDQAGAQC